MHTHHHPKSALLLIHKLHHCLQQPHTVSQVTALQSSEVYASFWKEDVRKWRWNQGILNVKGVALQGVQYCSGGAPMGEETAQATQRREARGTTRNPDLGQCRPLAYQSRPAGGSYSRHLQNRLVSQLSSLTFHLVLQVEMRLTQSGNA
jgi:hypothetical protein